MYSSYTVAPCKACLGCVKTNVCVIKDEGIALAEKAKEADALIIAGFTPYSTLDSRTKALMERLYPLRHLHGFMKGKTGGAMVTCAVPKDSFMLPPACDNGLNAISYYMMEEGMESIGSVRVLGNNPCVRCKFADECDMSGIKMMFGPDATKASAGINRFEEQPEAVAAAKELGQKIAEYLKSKE
ncbi:flavodoxin family protein [Methanolobus sp. ZRKC5]|uniref:flavodoxin family protein n=1 Tax=Methanolobus sp. ZRKC5 TaxID=3136295 RepID=UPI00313D8B5B